MLALLISFSVSILFVLGLLPVFAAGARKVGLVDHPDKTRKLHQNAIPLVGGITVACGALVGFGAVWLTGKIEFRDNDLHELLGMLLGSLVILIVGILDDRFALRGRQKLIGQILAVTVLLLFGYGFYEIAFATVTIKFGIFWFLFVYAWGLVAINSVNLIDGADGFASTVGIIIFLALGLMGGLTNDYVDGVICFAFAGALLGFLRYNFPPAKVFLGDAGSMLIGFVLAAITIRCQFKQASAYAVFAPVALLGIPLIDTGAAILRRRLTGRSIYTTDRGHLHHAMAKKGLSPRTSLLWVGFLTVTTATGGLLSMLTRQSEFAVLSIGIVMVVLVVGRIFGVAEFELVSRKAMGVFGSFLKKPGQKKFRQSTVQLQGDRNWETAWEQLCVFADENGLREITLDVNAPWIHESFHATRRLKKNKGEGSEEWESEIPLISDQRIFGRISFSSAVVNKLSHQEIFNNVVTVGSQIEIMVAAISASAPIQEGSSLKIQPETNEDSGLPGEPPVSTIEKDSSPS
jgi:UDP-GlcNAc:undecaprenyl-phosphate GlcNAc-1-phosphate transferase